MPLTVTRAPFTRVRHRRGWTLAELLVVLVIGMAVAGLGAGALAREQRSMRIAAELRAARADLRDAAAVLTHELRAAALTDTFRLATDTAVEFFVPILAAVTCAPSAGTRLLLAPLPPRSPPPPATITPDTGDLVWIWRTDTVLPPGRWVRAQVGAYAPQVTDSCDPRLIAPGARPRALTLTTDAGSVGPGEPVQVVRRGRHSLYRASDDAWYLGYRRCDALGPPRCQIVQPVAGPYRARSAIGAGLEFRYFADTGSPTEVPQRIELIVRSNIAGMARRTPRRTALDDSTMMAVALRNAF